MDISYSNLRQHLKQTLDKLEDTHEPVFIVSRNEKKAVLINYDDYSAMAETAYLLKSPAMAKRLLKSVSNIKSKKKLTKRGLIDVEA